MLSKFNILDCSKKCTYCFIKIYILTKYSQNKARLSA